MKLGKKIKGDTVLFGTIKELLGLDTQYENLLFIENNELVYTTEATPEEIKIFEKYGIKEQRKDCYWIVNEETLEGFKMLDGIVAVGTIEEFAQLVNTGDFTYAYACLGENIYLKCSDENQYTPIGNKNRKFDKIFDGNNYFVSGIYIYNENLDYQGLFGYNVGTIRNVGIKEGYIYAGVYVGGITGYSEGTVENCYNENTVHGNNNVGGIIGHTAKTSYTKECFNQGMITGNSRSRRNHRKWS